MITSIPKSAIFYPETDGKPTAENTIQLMWIEMVHVELDVQYIHRDDVFVAADLFWYPVAGKSKIVQAPDIFVVFGRPKIDRGSYQQWLEGGIPPQVVFEIYSPSNAVKEIDAKFSFYQRYGVEEYYLIDPYKKTVKGYRRRKDDLIEIRKIAEWTSPRLGIRFVKENGDLYIIGPDGHRFLKPTERIGQEKELAEKERAEKERERADKEQERAEKERERADKEALAGKLRELGIDPDTVIKRT